MRSQPNPVDRWVARPVFHRPANGTAVGLVACTLALLAASPPAQAVPIDVEYDFANGPSGWTSLNTSADGYSYPRQWTWGGGTWNVRPTTVLNSDFWVANNLTSPRILVDSESDALQLTVVHRYTFPTGFLTGKPLVAGQVVYRIGDSNKPFLPLLPGEFATGPIDPAYQSKTPYPDWVPPGGVASVSRDPPLAASGGIWQGTSPGFGSNQFVASRVLLENLVPGEEIEFRFINANLGFNCTCGLWEIASVDIQGLFVPEPAGLAWAAVGGLAAAGTLCRRGAARRAGPAARSRLTTSPPRRA